MSIASITFEDVFNNVANEGSDLPIEDLALEAMESYQELCDIESEITAMESISRAKQSLDGNVAMEAGFAELGGKIKELVQKIIKAFQSFIKLIVDKFKEFLDFIDLNRRWWDKNVAVIKAGWTNPKAKVKTGFTLLPTTNMGKIQELFVDAFDHLKEVADLVKKGELEKLEEMDTSWFGNPKAYVEQLQAYAFKVAPNTSNNKVQELQVNAVVPFDNAKNIVEGSKKADGNIAEINTVFKEEFNSIKKELTQKTKGEKQTDDEKKAVKAARKALTFTSHVGFWVNRLFNNSVSLCYKCARAAAKHGNSAGNADNAAPEEATS
jgi:hypothetical protein